MGVSKNMGTLKWMVKTMENPIKMDDLGGKTNYFRKHPYKIKINTTFPNVHPTSNTYNQNL